MEKKHFLRDRVRNSTNAAIATLIIVLVALVLLIVLYALGLAVGTTQSTGPSGAQGPKGLDGIQPGPRGATGVPGTKGFPGAQNPPLQEWQAGHLLVTETNTGVVVFPKSFSVVPKVFGVVLTAGYTKAMKANRNNAYLQALYAVSERGFSVRLTRTDPPLDNWESDQASPLFLYFAYVPQPTHTLQGVQETLMHPTTFWQREFSSVYALDI
jgi:hypothetical protein